MSTAPLRLTEAKQKPGPKPKSEHLKSKGRCLTTRAFHEYVIDKMMEQEGLWSRSEAVQKAIEEAGQKRGITYQQFERDLAKSD